MVLIDHGGLDRPRHESVAVEGCIGLVGAEQIRDHAEDPAEMVARSDQHGEVLRFLERLPENQQEVIRLKFQGEMSYKEISEVTSLSVGNVGFLIHSGLKRLRGLMSHQMA